MVSVNLEVGELYFEIYLPLVNLEECKWDPTVWNNSYLPFGSLCLALEAEPKWHKTKWVTKFGVRVFDLVEGERIIGVPTSLWKFPPTENAPFIFEIRSRLTGTRY